MTLIKAVQKENNVVSSKMLVIEVPKIFAPQSFILVILFHFIIIKQIIFDSKLSHHSIWSHCYKLRHLKHRSICDQDLFFTTHIIALTNKGFFAGNELSVIEY